MLKGILGALVTLAACASFAGEGITTVTCKGKGIALTLVQAQGGDSNLQVTSGGKTAEYGIGLNEKKNDLTAVIEQELVVAVGIKGNAEEVRLVSKKASSKKAFSASLSGTLPDNRMGNFPVSCTSKFEI